MEWGELVTAAQRIGWITYVATADAAGRPHVAAVAPGFTPGSVWFATRGSSKKARNLRENPAVGFHWPVNVGSGPGELAAWGSATILDSEVDRHRLWGAGVLPYDMSGFFGSADNPDLVVEAAIRRARLLGPDFTSQVWIGQPSGDPDGSPGMPRPSATGGTPLAD